MKNIFCILFIVVLLSGCNPQKYCAKHCPATHDTAIVVRTITHDSIVEKLVPVPVAVDSAAIRAKLAVDSAGNIHIVYIDSISNGNHVSAPQIIIRDNYITAKCKVDSFAVYAAVKEKYHKDSTDSKTVIKDTLLVPQYIKVPERYIPFIPKVFMWIGIVFVFVQIVKKSYQLWKNRK